MVDNDIYLLSVQPRTGTLIGYAHTEAANTTELIIWRNVERISLTLVTQIAGCLFLVIRINRKRYVFILPYRVYYKNLRKNKSFLSKDIYILRLPRVSRL